MSLALALPTRVVALAQQIAPRVRWVPPPHGSLRRGVWPVHSARVLLAVALALLVLTLVAALYRRLRRRP